MLSISISRNVILVPSVIREITALLLLAPQAVMSCGTIACLKFRTKVVITCDTCTAIANAAFNAKPNKH